MNSLRAKIVALSVLMVGLASFSSSASAETGIDSGGGDPLVFAAKPYPDLNQLDDAIEMILARVSASAYPQVFRERVLSELASLRAKESFLLVPSLILFNAEALRNEYALPSEVDQFIELGAVTRKKSGSPIIFSERVRRYSIEDLATVLLHEVLHHVLPQDVTHDEKYVDELSRALMMQEFSTRLQLGITHGIYVRSDFVSGIGLLRVLMERTATKWKTVTEMTDDEIAPAVAQVLASASIERNAARWTERRVADEVTGLLMRLPQFASFRLGGGWDKHLMSHVSSQLSRLAAELDPSNPFLAMKRTDGCRRKLGFFEWSCPDAERLTLKDLLDAARL